MLVGVREDLTSSVTLDAQLLAVSDSGLYINEGVHPSITIDNLLHFLPIKEIVPADYVAGTTYGKFEDSRLLRDIVISGGSIYESISAVNQGNTPATSPNEWLVTNLESLRLKVFINSVINKAVGDLNLVRRQVDSQYLYNLIEQNKELTPQLLPNDYAGYSFEAKGSDYTRFTINEVALQATTDTPQNLYVINQGELVDTLTLNPNADGRLVFEDTDYSIPANKGMWIFAIESQEVLSEGGYLDPLKFDGFVPRLVTGIGSTPESAKYSFGTGGNGLSFNITAHFDPAVYISKNLKNFGKLIRSCFELQSLVMYRANSNSRSNRQELIQMDENQLRDEVLVLSGNTSANKYDKALKEGVSMLDKTNDREISNNPDDFLTISLRPH